MEKKENKVGNPLDGLDVLDDDEDFRHLDGIFCTYLRDQTNYVKVKAELIDDLVGRIDEKLVERSGGMVPTKDVINEFSKAANHLEKAHSLLAIELVRLKGREIVKQAYVRDMLKERGIGVPEDLGTYIQ